MGACVRPCHHIESSVKTLPQFTSSEFINLNGPKKAI